MPPSNEPENVVQRQLDAYNARDLEAFMATYAEEAQLFELSSGRSKPATCGHFKTGQSEVGVS